MLDKYLSMQEDQLREMGERKQKHQERLNSAEAMLNQLEHLRDSMELLNRQSAYHLQQRFQMKNHIQELINKQEQQVSVVENDHLIAHQAMLQQYRKVKGFEVLKRKKEASEAQKERRREHKEADDWVSQSFGRM